MLVPGSVVGLTRGARWSLWPRALCGAQCATPAYSWLLVALASDVLVALVLPLYFMCQKYGNLRHLTGNDLCLAQGGIWGGILLPTLSLAIKTLRDGTLFNGEKSNLGSHESVRQAGGGLALRVQAWRGHDLATPLARSEAGGVEGVVRESLLCVAGAARCCQIVKDEAVPTPARRRGQS